LPIPRISRMGSAEKFITSLGAYDGDM